MKSISHQSYARLYGPTMGDQIRLGDTDLLIELEKDLTVYGEEVSFNPIGTTTNYTNNNKNYDLVIINVVIADWTGIYKADIGIKDGYIKIIGKAGDPNIQLGVTIEISAGTDIIDGKNLIITAGAIDTNAIFSDYDKTIKAFNAGVTTLIGGGQGTTDGTRISGVSCGEYNIGRMLKILDDVPVNIGLLAKGYSGGVEDAIKAGCMGVKFTPEWGLGIKRDTSDNKLYSDAVSESFLVADKYDVQVIATGSPANDTAFSEGFGEIIGNNKICINDVAGCEGGYTPDNITLLENENCFSSATTSALFLSKNILDSQFDLLMRGKNLSRYQPEHIALAESSVRKETIMAQEILLDKGFIPILTSSSLRDDSDLLIRQTWQLADKCKKTRGGDGVGPADNGRVKKFLAKYTINPAIVYGLADVVGSIQVGKIADLVLWQPAFFGISPFMVIKSGIACTLNEQHAPDNYDLNTTDKQGFNSAPGFNKNKIIFSSRSSIEQGVMENYGLESHLISVKSTRELTLSDMKAYPGSTPPKIQCDPETYRVRVNDELMTSESVSNVPLARFYNIF